MRICSYFMCRTRYDHKKPMFRFPVDSPQRLQTWLNNCGNLTIIHLPLEKLHNKSICIDHFDKRFVLYSGKRAQLDVNAVPYHYKGEDASSPIRSPSPTIQSDGSVGSKSPGTVTCKCSYRLCHTSCMYLVFTAEVKDEISKPQTEVLLLTMQLAMHSDEQEGNITLNSLTVHELSQRCICAAHFSTSHVHKGKKRSRLLGPAIPEPCLPYNIEAGTSGRESPELRVLAPRKVYGTNRTQQSDGGDYFHHLNEDLENYYEWKLMNVRPRIKSTAELRYAVENLNSSANITSNGGTSMQSSRRSSHDQSDWTQDDDSPTSAGDAGREEMVLVKEEHDGHTTTSDPLSLATPGLFSEWHCQETDWQGPLLESIKPFVKQETDVEESPSDLTLEQYKALYFKIKEEMAHLKIETKQLADENQTLKVEKQNLVHQIEKLLHKHDEILDETDIKIENKHTDNLRIDNERLTEQVSSLTKKIEELTKQNREYSQQIEELMKRNTMLETQLNDSKGNRDEQHVNKGRQIPPEEENELAEEENEFAEENELAEEENELARMETLCEDAGTLCKDARTLHEDQRLPMTEHTIYEQMRTAKRKRKT